MEELVRKLFLSAVVVLIESGSPLQVRMGLSSGLCMPAHFTLLRSCVDESRVRCRSTVSLQRL